MTFLFRETDGAWLPTGGPSHVILPPKITAAAPTYTLANIVLQPSMTCHLFVPLSLSPAVTFFFDLFSDFQIPRSDDGLTHLHNANDYFPSIWFWKMYTGFLGFFHIVIFFKKCKLSSRTRFIPVNVIVNVIVNVQPHCNGYFLLAARACFTCDRSLVLLGRFTFKISSSGT